MTARSMAQPPSAPHIEVLSLLVPPVQGRSFRDVYREHFQGADDPADDSSKARRLRAVRSMIEEGHLPPWAFLTPSPSQVKKVAATCDRARAALLSYTRHRELTNLPHRANSAALMVGMGVSQVRRRMQVSTYDSMRSLAVQAREGMKSPDKALADHARRMMSGVFALCSTDVDLWRPKYTEADACTSDLLHAEWMDAAEAAYRERWNQGWPGEGPAPGCPADDWDLHRRIEVLSSASLC